ncbi:hypothetical protein N9H74_06190 [Hyphomicrobiales bacterium]|nr:hypothetical protein [Hyphomicrobiales bacterium]
MSVPCPNPKCVILEGRNYEGANPILFFIPYIAPWLWFDAIIPRDKDIAQIITDSDREDWGIDDWVELGVCDRCGYRLGDPQPWQKNVRIKRFIFWILIILFFSWATIYSLLEDSGYFWVSLLFLFISLMIVWSNEDYKLSDDDE